VGDERDQKDIIAGKNNKNKEIEELKN